MRVVRTPARATQASPDLELFQLVLITIGSVLDAAVRVKNGRPFPAPLTNRMFERGQSQLRGPGSTERPPQDTTRITIHDCRQIQPAPLDLQVSHVANPGLVDPIDTRMILKQVFPGDSKRLQRRATLRHAGESPADLVFAHQPLDSLLAHANLLLTQDMMDSGAPVYPATLGVDGPDPFDQSLIFPFSP